MARGRASVLAQEARARVSNDGRIRCQVPGCEVDVGKLKDFNFRCRVCKDHSKADFVVMADGESHRFCQQCNKFQNINEFEEGKRGCREKLLIHNVRRQQRRKQKSLQKNLAVVLSDIGEGKRQPSKDEIQELLEGSAAPSAPKFGKVHMSPEHSSSSINSVGDGKMDKEIATGWQMPWSSKANDSGSGSGSFCGSVCHEESSKDVGTLFSGSANTVFHNSPPGNFPFNEAGSGCNFSFGNGGFGGNFMNFNDATTEPLNFETDTGNAYIDAGAPAHQNNGSFSGFRPELFSIADDLEPVDLSLPSMEASPPVSALNPGLLDDLVMNSSGCGHLCMGPGCFGCARGGNGLGNYLASSKQAMPKMPYGAEPEPLREEHMLRMSVKLDGMTPAGLPSDLNHRVQFAMQAGSDSDLMGYIRPGCVHLTIDCLTDPDYVDEVVRAMPNRSLVTLLAQGLPWDGKRVQALMPGWRLSKDEQGALNKQSAASFNSPEIKMVQIATADNVVEAVVSGWRNLHAPSILVRQDGAYVDVEISSAREMPDGSWALKLNLANAEFGVAWVEVVDDASGHFVMSEAFPTLITDNQEAVDELHRFTNSDSPISLPQAIALLRDAARVMHQDPLGEDVQESAIRLGSVVASRGCSELLSECIECLNGISLDQALLQTFLVNAVKSGNLQTVSDVLSHFILRGMEPQAMETDEIGMTVIHWAALSGCARILRVLLHICNRASEVWTSTQGPPPDHLVPRDMFNRRHDILQALEQQPQAELAGSVTKHDWPMIVLVLPILILAAVLYARPSRNEWGSWALAMLFAGLPEYMVRSGIWSLRGRLHSQLMAMARDSVSGVSLHPIKLIFQDTTMDAAYFHSWTTSTARFDVLVIAAAVVKLYCISHAVASLWLAVWAVPTLTMLLGRCLFPGSVQGREISNIVLSLFSWFCFFLGTTNQLHNPSSPETAVVWQLVLSHSLTAFFISAQNATVYPFRIRYCCISGMLHMALVTMGMQWRIIQHGLFNLDNPALTLAYSITLALVPGIWAAVGAELPCRQMEMHRMAKFLSGTTGKEKEC